MPFLQSVKQVNEYGDELPTKNPKELNNGYYPENIQLMNLIGGKAGNIGEKSYQPSVEFREGLFTPDSNTVDINTQPYYHSVQIKDENDCGYAIKILQDSNNKSNVSINFLNVNSEINIYSSSNNLKFDNLYSGVAQSKTAGTNLTNGAIVNDFEVLTNGTETISVVLDTELELNKNYLELNGTTIGDTCTKFLKKSISVADDTNSLLNVFVSEIDVNDKYISYISSGSILNTVTAQTSVTVTIESNKLFTVGDQIIIGDVNDDFVFVYGTITSYDSLSGLLIFTYEGSSKKKSTLSIGSYVCIYTVYKWLIDGIESSSNCISSTWTDSPSSTISDLRSKYGARNNFGLRFKHKRQKTNNNIIDYKNTFTWFKDSFVNNFNTIPYDVDTQTMIQSGGADGDPLFKFDRIGNRNYLKSQYSGKPELINKNKFSILFNGFYQYNSQYKYFNGYYSSVYEDILLQKKLLSNPKEYMLTVGCGAFEYTSLEYRPYFIHKLYEVLSYRNMQYLNTKQPQRIIANYLINKYKQKAFFSGSTEIQSDQDMYYSQVDRPNLFGKIKKIIS